jgi:hypothetical protein
MESRHKDKLRRQGEPLQLTEVLVPTIDPTDMPRPGAQTTLRAAMDRAAAVQRLAEDLPAELQNMLLMCDTPTALVALAVSLANTLSVMDLLLDDLCAHGLLTIDQIPVAPRHGQHRSTI